MPDEGGIRFSLDEVVAVVEDLMRIADELNRSGDEVNAYLLDLVVNRLLEQGLRRKSVSVLSSDSHDGHDVTVTARLIQRETPLMQLRVTTGGDSPDGRKLSQNAVVVEWAGRVGHPTSYALLGLVPRSSGVTFSMSTDPAPFPESLAGASDEVTFDDLNDRWRAAIREVLEQTARAWDVVVAATGKYGSSEMAFRFVAAFIEAFIPSLEEGNELDEAEVWTAWDVACASQRRTE